MKQFICLALALSFVVSLLGQAPGLKITTDKTTSLVFSGPILHVDRGSRDILVQPVPEADNILLVKAGLKNFSPTNLSVVTSDGSIYCFSVSYGEPTQWVHRFPSQFRRPVSACAETILDNPGTIRGIKDASWQIIARVIGIYIRGEEIFYQLELSNQSSIDYDINFLRFFVRDRKRAKRTAVQQKELTPLFTAGDTSKVRAGTHNSIVVAFKKFTIPAQNYLAIEIGEQNGGRNLLMKVSNSKIIKATVLPN